MSEWKECKLGDQINLKRGYDLPTHLRQDGKIPIYSSSGITGFHNEKMCNAPGVITGRYGTIGQIFYAKTQYWPLNTTLYIEDFKGNDELFFYYFLTQLDWDKYSDKSAVPGVNRNDVHQENILIPSLPEQKAIAAVLSSLDDKIDLLHRQNKTLEAMAETLFRQWFIEEAQEDWEEKSLGELVTITSSKRIFYSEYVNTGVPFYRSKEIIELSTSGSTKSELYITEERFNDIQKRFGSPLEGDILLTSVGTLGIPYRVKNNDRFYFKDGNLTWFRDFGNIPSIIIFCWLKSSIGKGQLESITIGSTQAALTISGLKEIQLIIPPQNLMKDLEVKLTYIYNKVDFNQSQIQTLEKLRDTLLPKLMSGEVRVTYNG